MKRAQIVFNRILLITCSLFLVACNSDENKSYLNSYLFYSGSLHAVDPAKPTSPIQVDASGGYLGIISAGSYDVATKTFTNYHQHSVMYSNGFEGKLYQVSAHKSGSALTPVQLTNESSLICDSFTAVDYQDPNKSQFVYTLPKTSSTSCSSTDASDYIWKMARLDMTGDDMPLPAMKPFIAIRDVSTGALTAWLILDFDDFSLKHCDTVFQNCGLPLTTNANFLAHVQDYGQYHLINIDENLHVYDDVANTLSSSLLSEDIRKSISDGTYFYFTDNFSIYKAPIDGSVTAIALYTSSDEIRHFHLTTNKLVFLDINGDLFSLEKDGGTPTPLASSIYFGDPSLIENPIFTAGKLIYYTRHKQPDTLYAEAVDENGANKSVIPNAQWVGATLSTKQDMSFGNLDKVIRAEGYGPDLTLTNGTFKAVDASTGLSEVILGTMPMDLSAIACNGLGDYALCSAEVIDGSQWDIVFLNLTHTASLQRVTNTPTVDENLLVNVRLFFSPS